MAKQDRADVTQPGPLPGDRDEPAAGSAGPGGALRFARMTGSSIAGRNAAPWVTDFLDAAYYRRPETERDVDDVRLAFSILTTFWYRKNPGRRLRLGDLAAFHRAYGTHRFDTDSSERGLLTREQLFDGATTLLGDWFPDAYADDARRGWGIAFATPAERDAYDPGLRLALAPLGPLTPESGPLDEQTWHTYAPVRVPSARRVIELLNQPHRWPDFASELGRFTPLRPGGLANQTFEIDVAAGTDTGRPLFTRGYVTITALVTPDEPDALARYFAELGEGLRRYSEHEPEAMPHGGEPIVGFDLTTHQGHFMGAGHNRLILYHYDGADWLRAAGTWDPMPWYVDGAYRFAGQGAQGAFWGESERAATSVLHQLAECAA